MTRLLMTKQEEELYGPAEERVFRLKAELNYLVERSQDPENDAQVRAKQAELAGAEQVLARIMDPIIEKNKYSAFLRRTGTICFGIALVLAFVGLSKDFSRPWLIAAAIFGAIFFLAWQSDPYKDHKRPSP